MNIGQIDRYGSGPMMAEKACAPYQMSLRERLQTQETQLSQQLTRVRDAIAALEANPGAADLFEKISAL